MIRAGREDIIQTLQETGFGHEEDRNLLFKALDSLKELNRRKKRREEDPRLVIEARTMD